MTTLPRTVLFDIDGTLALRDESDPNVRHFAAWNRVGEDLPNAAVIELAQLVAESGRYKLIVMSVGTRCAAGRRRCGWTRRELPGMSCTCGQPRTTGRTRL